MGERNRRLEILARIESGELSAEQGVAALMEAAEAADERPRDASEPSGEDVEVDVTPPATNERSDERIDVALDGPPDAEGEGLDPQFDDLPRVGLEVEIDPSASEEVRAGHEPSHVTPAATRTAGPSPRGEGQPAPKSIQVVVDRGGEGPGERSEARSLRSEKSGRMRINLAGFLGGEDARSLRVRIGDGTDDDDRVRIDLPVGLAEAGLRWLERLDPEGRWAEHRERLSAEGEHTLLEFIEDDGERVRISVG